MRLIGKLILWIFALLGGLVALSVAAVIVFTLNVREDAPDMPDSAVLSLNWNEVLEERYATIPTFEPVPPSTLLDTVTAIDRAAGAPQVKALVANLGAAPMGFARAQELAAAVRRFRESGKPAFVYAEDLGMLGDGTPEYMLAAAFDEIWMQPSGLVGLTGVALETPFFAEGLSELGISAEFEQRHEFKGGADPMVRESMSEPVRRSLTVLVEGLLDQAVTSIASDRGIPPGEVRALVDSGPHLGRDAISSGLIDVLDYADGFEAHVDRVAGADAQWIEPPFLLAATELQDENPVRVAVLYGIGAIGLGGGDGLFADPGFDAEGLIGTLDEIVEDGGYDAILFRVDSPGGAYGPSDAVWHAIGKARSAGIPIIVSMGDVAASGGYFVAAGADRIVAYPGTITGSIGVYGGKFDASALWQRLGVRWDRVAAGENAGMWSFNRGFDAAERRRFADAIDFVYEDFTTKVAGNRGFSAVQINNVARGRIWLGSDSLDAGLVDRLGGYAEALEEVRSALSLAPDTPLDLTVLPHPKSPWEALAEALQSGDLPFAFGTLIADATERRVVQRVEAVMGNIDGLFAPRGLLSAPPIRLKR